MLNGFAPCSWLKRAPWRKVLQGDPKVWAGGWRKRQWEKEASCLLTFTSTTLQILL